MEAYYPISALAHGQALNITVMSYAGGLYFGFTACPDRVPSVQRVAVYTRDALEELEKVFIKGVQPRIARPAREKSAKVRAKTPARRAPKKRAAKQPAARAAKPRSKAR
jgi:hypothetical protein